MDATFILFVLKLAKRVCPEPVNAHVFVKPEDNGVNEKAQNNHNGSSQFKAPIGKREWVEKEVVEEVEALKQGNANADFLYFTMVFTEK